MLQNQSEINSIGGGYGGFGGFGSGFGGFGLFGLLGLRGLGDFDGRGRRGDDDGCRNEIATLAAIASAKDTTVAEGRALGAAICATNDAIKDGNYAAAIQAERNTAQLAAQAQAFQIATDKSLDALAAAGVAQTASILARINDVEVQGLRDQLHNAHRHSDTQEINIAISNSNAQAQAQFQAQNNDWNRKFDAILGSFNQLNRNTQDIINLGTMTGSGTQANQQTNIK